MGSEENNKLIRLFKKQLMPTEKVMPSQELRDYISEKFRKQQTSQADNDMEEMSSGFSESYENSDFDSDISAFFENSATYFSNSSGWDSYNCPASSSPSAYHEEPKAAVDTANHFRIVKKTETKSEAAAEIDRLIRQRDESFQQMLFREIDSRGMTDVECYQRAHMDRKTFSKIRGDIQYKPKKTTAVSLALALRMTTEEANELLKKAGFILSDSNVFDVIIQYYLEKEKYDLFEINETLFYYDQPLLGSR